MTIRFTPLPLILVALVAFPGAATAKFGWPSWVRREPRFDVQLMSKFSIKDRLKDQLGPRVGAHVERERGRYVGGMFQRYNGDLGQLDLKKLLPDRLHGAIPEARHLLSGFAQRHSTVWHRDLGALAAGAANPKLRDALLEVRAHVVKRGGGELDSSMKQIYEDLFLNRMSGRIFAHHRRKRATRTLSGLPWLPRPPGVRLTLLWLKSLGRGEGRTSRYLRLERKATELRCSKRRGQRKLGKRLSAYLSSYKDKWADRWLDERLHAFPGPAPAARCLRDVTESTALGGTERAAMDRRLDQAWAILGRVVHPGLLDQAGLPQIRVTPEVTRASYHKGTIKLGPDSSVQTILHEVGHFLEERGGIRSFVTAQVLRAGRVSDGRMQALGPKELGFRGAFPHPYMGKHYLDGSTEIFSMGLQSLATKERALQLFKQDGDYLLRVLSALQRPPHPL